MTVIVYTADKILRFCWYSTMLNISAYLRDPGISRTNIARV